MIFNHEYNSMHSSKNATADENLIQIDGFQQVLDLLKVADPNFRESLLKRLAVRDARLVSVLRQNLRTLGL